MERVGWLFSINKGFWNVNSDNTYRFGLADRVLQTGKHALRFFEQAKPAANRLSVVDVEALRVACEHAASNSLFSSKIIPSIQWVKAFYSTAACCWVNER